MSEFRDHIGLTEFEKMNWLPINDRFDQWISSVTFKYFNNLSPLYMSDVFKPADQIVVPWFSGYHDAMVWWLSLLHNFIQLSLNSGSAQVQTLLTACQRFVMVMISDTGLF